MSQTITSAKPISPLRRRMIEDMTVRGFGEKTQSDYIRHVKNFTIFLRRSPDTATPEDVRAYQLSQREAGVQPPTMNATTAALRFFFTTTCGQAETVRHLRIVKQAQKLPVVLTQDEVLLLLEAAASPRDKAAMAVAYGAGLRVSEVVNLKISDVDSDRMVLRIEQGKGQKDRNGMLSPRLLEVLREWWLIGQPPRHGCSRVAIRSTRSRRSRSTERCATPPRTSASRSASRRTRCGTALRRICSSRASIFESSRWLSDIRSWIRRHAMRMWRARFCARW